MDQQTEERILEKAEYVSSAVGVLATKRDSLSFEDYRHDREQRAIVEREFETAIEACLDIGRMILKAEALDVPTTNSQVFHKLDRADILTTAVAEKMAEAAGFRNILSHQYGNDINDRDVFNALQNSLSRFHSYLNQIRDHLS